jgi:hypothetical protein
MITRTWCEGQAKNNKLREGDRLFDFDFAVAFPLHHIHLYMFHINACRDGQSVGNPVAWIVGVYSTKILMTARPSLALS